MDLRCKYSPKLNIAITGSTGFVGCHLVEAFKSADFEATPLEKVGVDAAVIHLAADVSPTREAMLANIAMDTYLLDIVNQQRMSLIYASSNNVYPFALDCRINELARCNDYYAASKILGEKLFLEWVKSPVISVRIGDVFGVGQRHGNFFKAIEQAIREETPLKIFGRGQKRRTYIHVHELCEMLKFIALNVLKTAQANMVLNLGYPDSLTVAEIISIVAGITGSSINSVPLEVDYSDVDIRTMQCSSLYEYEPHWGSFYEALASFIQEIQSEHKTRPTL